MFLLIVNEFFSGDLCDIEDACLSAIWLVSLLCFICCFACSVCVMFGSMEMFGPQGSVGFMCVIFVLSRTFVHSFVLSLSLYLS